MAATGNNAAVPLQTPVPNQHRHPRRTNPENSITLRNHRLARDASIRALGAGASSVGNALPDLSPRRNSSDESNETGMSDPRKWFDQANERPSATFQSNVMDVDPPFFQRHSGESSGEDKSYLTPFRNIKPRLVTRDSSNDDYRSVIDDLTIEIQKLKEELRKHKQKGPDTLRKDMLFEIKYHNLSKRKRNDLEAKLRDFSESVADPSEPISRSSKVPKRSNPGPMDTNSGYESMSKHASSASDMKMRPADSAYASMTAGGKSSLSTQRPSGPAGTKSLEQRVENYLRDIPEGLHPRNMVLSEKEKKKLVVRRLEQLFTGKISGHHVRRLRQERAAQQAGTVVGSPLASTDTLAQQLLKGTPSRSLTNPDFEPSREARMLLHEQSMEQNGGAAPAAQGGHSQHARGSFESENYDSGVVPDEQIVAPAHLQHQNSNQRPTRPKDLDPDRTQVPSENMEYMKHLGLVLPEAASMVNRLDVGPDADGWVYLNLLCNLAQLHIMNVTPSFVRSAVSEMSQKFQLSRDGAKIRWRGGTEGTAFNSDSSGNNSQRSLESEASEQLSPSKRRKLGPSTGNDLLSGGSSKYHQDEPQASASDNIHYKPLFVHHESNPLSSHNGSSTPADPADPADDSNIGSRNNNSGSGSSIRKRRRDGAIIYYRGATFCTDLSGEPEELSPSIESTSESRDLSGDMARKNPPEANGVFENRQSLSHSIALAPQDSRMDTSNDDVPDLTTDSSDASSDFGFDPCWSVEPQYLDIHRLEPCGLGGVLPDDHFMVVVTTKRPKMESSSSHESTAIDEGMNANAEHILARLALNSVPSPAQAIPTRAKSQLVNIEYVSGRIKRLPPVALPPPGIFFSLSTDSSASSSMMDDYVEEEEESDDDMDEENDDDDTRFSPSDRFSSQRAYERRADAHFNGIGQYGSYDSELSPLSRNEVSLPAMVDASRYSSAEAAAGTVSPAGRYSASTDFRSRANSSGLMSDVRNHADIS